MFKCNKTLKKLFDDYKTGSKIISVLVLSCAFSVQAASSIHIQELIQQLGILQQDLVNLEQGKVVSFQVTENDKKELAAGVAIYISSAPVKVVEFLRNKGMIAVDTEIISQSLISPQATLSSFKELNFKLGDKDEADFLSAKPGDTFNLSAQEFKTLQTIKSEHADSIAEVYKKILFERWQGYRKEGLKGIATYDRGAGRVSDPGKELRTAILSNKVLFNHFPELYQAWLNYPGVMPANAEERFFLINRQVENRSTAVLLHRIILAEKAGGIILSRQFYVGHSYNSNQFIIGCLPYRNGSLIFYTNRTFTDQVAGFGSGLKHSIGREQMRRRMEKHLINIKNALK
ncbi:hypothetical protein [Nitrosomonas ureae]|uniref:Uncharacterized protein n=1 Tax=Nitrosomonas ureae TaxID=44577 RepID=A0A2T5ID39_9PROT|nr:hypothetical protein [Nitrosomonas ureae]PTQ81748.1 hypothetical protein C8R28_103014 [Nitrosomonas ureae]PXX08335.1 hypothetical protein C8R27_14410 [Nitrosomonas ureae]